VRVGAVQDQMRHPMNECLGLARARAGRDQQTMVLKELWAKVANECLERTGDEGRVIREANAVVARQAEDG